MGSGLSQLTQEQVIELKETTPLVEADMVKLLKRYSQYDNTEKGTDGIPYAAVLSIPELRCNPIIPPLLDLYLNPSNHTLYPEKFLYLFALLNEGTSVEKKRKVAFQCFDTSKTGRLGRPEVFRMYKWLYGGVLSDDQILDLTDQTLTGQSRTDPGYITAADFQQMVSDWEINRLFTVHLQ